MFGLFDGMFDFNNDGQLDSMEQAAEFATVASVLDDCLEDEQTTELEESGLDPDELEFMDAAERREALEDAGLDPV